MYPPEESVSIRCWTAITPRKDTQEWGTGSMNMFTLLTLRLIFIIRWTTHSSLMRHSQNLIFVCVNLVSGKDRFYSGFALSNSSDYLTQLAKILLHPCKLKKTKKHLRDLIWAIFKCGSNTGHLKFI